MIMTIKNWLIRLISLKATNQNLTVALHLVRRASDAMPPHLADAAIYRQQLERLPSHGEHPLDQAQIEYWADRFGWFRIHFWAGCSFETYLAAPDRWEAIADQNRSSCAETACASRALIVGKHVQHILINFN